MSKETRKFPTDPLEVIRVNDAHRSYDVGDKDLWSADELAVVPKASYGYQVPIFVPNVWPRSVRIDQKEYDERFAERSPLTVAILRRINKGRKKPLIVVAGGAAAYPYCEPSTRNQVDDDDLFVVGCDPKNRRELWKVAKLVFDTLRSILVEQSEMDPGNGEESIFGEWAPHQLFQRMNPGVMTFAVQLRKSRTWNSPVKILKLQLILRAYPSPGAAIHGFDIGSSCTYYDGKTAYSTTLGAYAHRFRINLVNPSYRSTTYERRLSKYFSRHYALGLVHLKPGSMKKGEALELTHLKLEVEHTSGNWATGAIVLPKSKHSDYSGRSDYESLDLPAKGYWDVYSLSVHAPNFHNLKQCSTGQRRYVYTRCCESLVDRRTKYDWMPMDKWVETDGPALSDFFPEKVFDGTMDRLVNAVVTPKGRISTKNLGKYFGMKEGEIKKLVRALVSLVSKNPGKKIDVSGALKRFTDKARSRHKYELTQKINWWITVDPGRQYTAALNPRMENPAGWYGHYAIKTPAGKCPDKTYVDSLKGQEEGKDTKNRAPLAGTCTLCMVDVKNSRRNLVILPCRHIYHFARDVGTGCEGLIGWILLDKYTCPVCRAVYFGDAPPAKREAVTESLRLVIDWDSDDDQGNSTPAKEKLVSGE
jgi:hypothetical protein